MQIITDIWNIQKAEECSVALGVFDGMHLGHQRVIESAIERGFQTAVFTFSVSPKKSEKIVTDSERISIFKRCGVERLYNIDFNKIRNIEPQVFLNDILLGKLNTRKISCGQDYRFGKDASGNVDLIKNFCRENGITCKIVEDVTYNGEKISSTRIRNVLKKGDIKSANDMLGRPFGFCLEVVHGNHIGTGLGMPTINQALPKGFVQPKFGVYASIVEIRGKKYYGVTNIGVKPTVGSDRVLSETWIPNFNGDLYGEYLNLYLYEFIREERKFNSLDEMKIEVNKNAKTAQNIIGSLFGKVH